MALEVLERANLHSNSWKIQKIITGMILPKIDKFLNDL